MSPRMKRRCHQPMNDYPLAPRATPMAVATPVIPLHFIHPGLSLAQMLSIVWAHRGLTILIVLLVASLTGLGLRFWPRTYTATATLMVNYEVNDPLNGKELPVGQVGSYIATQVELMQTPGVLLTVVDRLGLTQRRRLRARLSRRQRHAARMGGRQGGQDADDCAEPARQPADLRDLLGQQCRARRRRSPTRWPTSTASKTTRARPGHRPSEPGAMRSSSPN